MHVGQDLPFTVGAVVDKGSVASVTLSYGSHGLKAWKTLPLASVGDGLCGGTIPGTEIYNKGIEYHVTATTANRKTLASAKSASLPDVASAPYGDPDPGPYGGPAPSRQPNEEERGRPAERARLTLGQPPGGRRSG